MAAFKREAQGELITHLIDVAQPLDHHPLLSRAVTYWRGNIQRRRPFCISCKESFAAEARVGAFLFAHTAEATPKTALVSALCDRCWQTLPMAEVEDVALRVMAKLLRGAQWQ